MAGAGVTALAGILAGGCASPKPPPVTKPPGVVVPGVVGGGSGGSGGQNAPGTSGGSGGSGPSGKAGSRGTVLLGAWAPGGARDSVASGALAYFKWLNAR